MIKSHKSSRSNTTTNDRKAIIYSRVSSERQKIEGLSLPTQTRLNWEYAIQNDLEVIAEYEEDESAYENWSSQETSFIGYDFITESIKNRPKLQEIIQKAQNREFKYLIVQSRDRLARDYAVFCSLRILFDKLKIEIHYTKPGEKVSTKDSSMNNFIDLILANIAEFESNLIGVRVKSNHLEAAKSGYWINGKVPFGYISSAISGKRKSIVASDYEKLIVQEVFELYGQGYSYRKIAEIINKRHELESWTKGKVESVLSNQVYLGKIVWGRRMRKKGKFIPNSSENLIFSPELKDAKIIDNNTWSNASKLRSEKSVKAKSLVKDDSKNKDSKYYSTPFILRGKLCCPQCDTPLKCKSHGKDGNGNIRGEYYCNNAKCSYGKVKKDIIERQFIAVFTDTYIRENIDMLWGSYSKTYEKMETKNRLYRQELEQKRATLEAHIAQIKIKTPNCNDKILKELLMEEELRMSSEIEKYKSQIESKYIEPVKYKDKESFQNGLLSFLRHIQSNTDTELLRMMIDTFIHKVTIKSSDCNSPSDEASIDILQKIRQI